MKATAECVTSPQPNQPMTEEKLRAFSTLIKVQLVRAVSHQQTILRLWPILEAALRPSFEKPHWTTATNKACHHLSNKQSSGLVYLQCTDADSLYWLLPLAPVSGFRAKWQGQHGRLSSCTLWKPTEKALVLTSSKGKWKLINRDFTV